VSTAAIAIAQLFLRASEIAAAAIFRDVRRNGRSIIDQLGGESALIGSRRAAILWYPHHTYQNRCGPISVKTADAGMCRSYMAGVIECFGVLQVETPFEYTLQSTKYIVYLFFSGTVEFREKQGK